MKNFKQELYTNEYYNTIVFWMTKFVDYDFSTEHVREIGFTIKSKKLFERFIKEANLDEDFLFDYCLTNNDIDEALKLYNKMHKDLELLGFNLV